MAGKQISSQLNIGFNVTGVKGAKSLGEQITQAVGKSLGPALEKVFSSAAQQFAKTVKNELDKVARDAGKVGEQIDRSAAQRATRRAASAGAGGPGGAAPTSAQIAARDAASLRMGRRLQRAAGFQVTLGQAEAAMGDLAPRDREQLVYQAQDKQRIGRSEARQASRDAASEARKQTKAEKSEQLAERNKQKSERQEQRRQDKAAGQVGRADRELARLRGGEDPQLAQLEKSFPDTARQLRQERRLNAMFPGSARLNRAVGGGQRTLSMIRGVEGLAPIAAGIRSGNPLAGLAGGFASGGAEGALAGFGGLGAGLVGGGLAVAGAYGAFLKSGMDRAGAQVGRGVGFAKSLAPSMRVAPSMQGDVATLRGGFQNLIFDAARFGLDPEEALQVALQVQQGGGFAGSPSMMRAQREALVMHRAIGLSGATAGEFEIARRRGGLAGLAGLSAGTLATQLGTRAFGMGFSDEESAGLLDSFAGQTRSARGMGTFVNLGSQMGAIGSLSGSIGQTQAARMAGGLQGMLSDIATKGPGSGNPLTNLMALQSFGGLQLGGGPIGAKQLVEAQKNIERNGVTSGGLEDFRQRILRSAGGNTSLATLLAQQQLPFSMGATNMQSWLSGAPMSDDVLATITSAASGQREGAALGGSFEARGLAVTPEEARNQAGIGVADVRAGLGAAPGAQRLDAALAQTAQSMAAFSSTIDVVKGKLSELGNAAIPWSTP